MIAALWVAILSSASAQPVPARIVNPTAASRAALLEAVRSALDGAPVTLADDALTRESVLVIERAPKRDSSGRRLQGREVAMPDRFSLVRSGGACVLIHERTGRSFPLANTECAELR